MYQRERFNVFQGAADLGFGLSGALIVMLLILILVIGQENEDESGIKPGAYYVHVTWGEGDDMNLTDVDTWVEDPKGVKTGYSNKDPYNGLWALLKDDTGMNSTYNPKFNEEWVFTAGVMKGWWTVNLHLFSLKEELPVSVHVTITHYPPPPGFKNTIFDDSVLLNFPSEEKTLIRWRSDSEGNVLETSYEQVRVRTEGRMHP